MTSATLTSSARAIDVVDMAIVFGTVPHALNEDVFHDCFQTLVDFPTDSHTRHPIRIASSVPKSELSGNSDVKEARHQGLETSWMA